MQLCVTLIRLRMRDTARLVHKETYTLWYNNLTMIVSVSKLLPAPLSISHNLFTQQDLASFSEEPEREECGICMDAKVEVEINECHHQMCCECAKAICCLEVRLNVQTDDTAWAFYDALGQRSEIHTDKLTMFMQAYMRICIHTQLVDNLCWTFISFNSFTQLHASVIPLLCGF